MTGGVFPANALGYLINFMESLRFLEERRENIQYDSALGFLPRASKNMVMQTYLALNEAQKKEFADMLTPDQRFYFDTFGEDMIRLKLAAQVGPPKDFLPFITARVDILLISNGASAAYFQFTHVSDLGCKVSKPEWFQKAGCGYVLHSYAGKLALCFVPQAGGQITLYLRGMYIRDPVEESVRVPYWIDYTSLHVNGNAVFSSPQPAWHDKPYRHSFDVSEGEEVSVRITWLPHRSD